MPPKSRSTSPFHGFNNSGLPVSAARDTASSNTRPSVNPSERDERATRRRINATSTSSDCSIGNWNDTYVDASPTPSTIGLAGDTIIEEINHGIPELPESAPESGDEFHELDNATSPETSIVTVRQKETGTLPTAPDKTARMSRGFDQLPREVQELVRAALIANTEYEDEYLDIEPDNLPEQALAQSIAAANSLKTKYNSFLPQFQLEYATYSDQPQVVKAIEYKRDLNLFVRTALGVQRERELEERQRNQIASQDPAKAIKKSRVTANTDKMLHELTRMTGQMKIYADSHPENDHELLVMSERVAEAKLTVDALISDGLKLLDDATDAGLADQAESINESVTALRSEAFNASQMLTDNKSAFGILSTNMSNVRSDLSPPKFSGTGEPDFFTFKQDWTKYIASKPMSEAERFQVLTKTCLSGQARNISNRFETVPEVFEQLQKTYGNARLLFQNKIEALKKLGKCGGSDLAMREWVIEIRSHMEIINKLAVDHKLTEALHMTGLVGYIQEKMPYRLQKGFKKAVRQKDSTGNLAPSLQWEVLSNHMDHLVEELTFEVNHSLNIGTGNVISAASAKAENTKLNEHKKSGSQNKRINAAIPANTYAVATAATPTAAMPAAATTAAAGNTASTASKQKKVKAKPQDKTVISAAYTAPSEVECCHCGIKHSHAFYCKIFQAARDKERVSVAAKMRCCFSCLRMDAQQDPQAKTKEARDEWYSKHEVHCKTEWTCEQGKCKKMSGRYKWHFLMCSYHCEENKPRISDFMKTVDMNKLTSGTDFFFCMPNLMYQLSAPPIEAGSGDPLVYGDVSAPSIFMLQRIPVKDQELLCFYDSGCGGSALTAKAAALLESVSVRDGPTVLNVAGGRTIRIEGGDERFKLALRNNNKKATFTGLKMESITTKFPVWRIEEAWKEIVCEAREEKLNVDDLPPMPKTIGGCPVDLMIGIRYLKWYPTLLFILPSGLGVYRSQIAAPRDEALVLGGPHSSWVRCAEESNFVGPHSFFSNEYRAYNFACATLKHVLPDVEHFSTDRIVELPLGGEGEEAGLDVKQERHQAGPANPALSCAITVLDTQRCGPDRPDQEEKLASEAVTWIKWMMCLTDEVEAKIKMCEDDIFLSQSTEPEIYHDLCWLYEDEYREVGDVCEQVHCDLHNSFDDFIIPPEWNVTGSVYSLRDVTNRYLESELSGSEIQFRCVRCRNCARCRDSSKFEATSIREEKEQYMIEQSVNFDTDKGRLVASLPFVKSPKENLTPNRYQANKVLESQMKLISKSEQMRSDVLESFDKLASKGYFLPVASLPSEIKKYLDDPKDAGYIIPWRVVYKEGSLSTPCRMVFDASSRTPGGLSLNDCLAKGENNLVRIHDILLRFRSLPSAFSTDIKKAYNQLAMDMESIRYQKFLWKDDLLEDNETADWVIATVIYGVRPSGNQTAAGFSKVADFSIENYPDHKNGAMALKKSTYVDDVLKSDVDIESAKETAKSLDFTLKLANIEVKSYVFSGEVPSDEVSEDGVHVGAVGMVWAPKEDVLSIDLKPLFFGKTKRGKMPELVTGPVKPALEKNFTRRNMLAKTASIFDPLGLATPVTAKYKLDLHDLVERKMGWDDLIPETYLETWVENLEEMQKLRGISYDRSIVPPNAESNEVELIVSCDASKDIAIATVHAKTKLKNGSYECRLVSAKSRLVKELTIPKAELRGCVLAVHLAHAVKHSLGDQLKSTIYVTDSAICLFWLTQDERPLETLVKNAVVEILRFSSPTQWFHVSTDLNIADLGTRTANIRDLDRNSAWQKGPDWMKLPKGELPVKTVDQMKLTGEERRLAYLGTRPPDIQGIITPLLRTEVAKRYEESNYLVDPNKYCWERAIRVTAMAISFVKKIQQKTGFPVFHREWFPPAPDEKNASAYWVRDKPVLSEFDLRVAKHYYFKKATEEVLRVTPKKELAQTDLRNGILYYTGRILHGQPVLEPEDVMLDLDPLCFVRPVVDRYSPIAYSIMIHTHQNVVHHRGAISTLRASRNEVYILRGRDLAVEIRENCKACTRYKRKLLEVEIGPIHSTRLTVAPPFYYCQVDLFGPLMARCEHNHRAAVRVYGCVFKCPATGAIGIHAMPSYNTESFLAAYTRFAAVRGHPAKLFIDKGTQLLKACQKMEINITDLANNLATKYKVGVEYQTCPVQGHNQHGVVERAIKTIKELLAKVFGPIKMDSFYFETAFAFVANELNNMPMCLGSRIDNLDHTDLITPSRLMLGRASTRALEGQVRISPPGRMLQQMDEVYESWWRTWSSENLVDYIPKPPHWKDGNVNAKVGDIVLMLLSDSEKKLGAGVWRLGRIKKLFWSADGITRVAELEYRNNDEKTFRKTERALSSIAIIHRDTDLDVIQELNAASKEATIHFYKSE